MDRIGPIDPTVEMKGSGLRDVIIECIEWGKVRIGWHGGQDRMAERGISGGEVLSALESGSLTTDQCVAGVWRYLARRNDVAVCFCFDVDEDGNVLIVVTLMRKD